MQGGIQLRSALSAPLLESLAQSGQKRFVSQACFSRSTCGMRYELSAGDADIDDPINRVFPGVRELAHNELRASTLGCERRLLATRPHAFAQEVRIERRERNDENCEIRPKARDGDRAGTMVAGGRMASAHADKEANEEIRLRSTATRSPKNRPRWHMAPANGRVVSGRVVRPDGASSAGSCSAPGMLTERLPIRAHKRSVIINFD